MASIEATKRAFGEAETVQRRRHRAEREKKGSDKGGQEEGLGNGGESRQRVESNHTAIFSSAVENTLLQLDFY